MSDDVQERAYASLLNAASTPEGRRRVADLTGLSSKTIDDYVKSRSRFVGAQDRSKKEIIRWYQKYSIAPTPYSNLYKAINECMERSGEGDLQRFEGSFSSYRKSSDEGEFITGKITIEFSDKHQAWMHTHDSIQNINNRDRRFFHEGPVLLVENRLYLLGIGNAQGSRYIRVMIMKNVDEPRTMPITGMLLTERAIGNIPFASKIVMYNADFKPSDEELGQLLQNESTVADILYGWGEV